MPAPARRRRLVATLAAVASVLLGTSTVVGLLGGVAAAQASQSSGPARPAAAPSVTQAVCTGPGRRTAGQITIPADADAHYAIAGVPAAPGAHGEAAGDYRVTATAAAGKTLTGPTAWRVTVTPVDCTVTVTPKAPTVTEPACPPDPQGPAVPTYTIPDVPGVDYYDGSTRLVAGATYDATIGGTVTITARAQRGYRLDPSVAASFPLTFAVAAACAGDAVVAIPGFRPASCTGPGTSRPAEITIPDAEGVDYSIDGALVTPGTRSIGPGDHAVTATPRPGYRLGPGPTAFTVTVPARPGCLVAARPARPSLTPAGCVHETLTRPSYTVPAVTGVVYAVDGGVRRPGVYRITAGAVVRVVAVPADGYRFSGPQYARYTLHVARTPTCVRAMHVHVARAETPARSARPGGVASSVAEHPVRRDQASVLPFTGTDTLGLLIAAGAALAAGVALVAAGSRRRPRRAEETA